jgi:hypothetical protein
LKVECSFFSQAYTTEVVQSARRLPPGFPRMPVSSHLSDSNGPRSLCFSVSSFIPVFISRLACKYERANRGAERVHGACVSVSKTRQYMIDLPSRVKGSSFALLSPTYYSPNRADISPRIPSAFLLLSLF